jgi:hypothetical protein
MSDKTKEPKARRRRRYYRAPENTHRFMRGSYANPDRETKKDMRELGDDLGLLARLERDLTRAWKPQDSMQALIVADLAKLYWRKTHLERTVVANRVGERRRVNETIQLHNLDENSSDDPLEPGIVEISGYRGIPDSGEAYEESMKLLDRLHRLVEDRDWTADVARIITLLYGENTAPNGREILDIFAGLADPDSEMTDEDEQTAAAQLKNLVLLEKASVLRQQTVFRLRRREEVRGALGSVWVPTTEKWDLMMAQDAHLDRMIESKTKLLIRLQGLRPAEPASPNGQTTEVQESEWRSTAVPATPEFLEATNENADAPAEGNDPPAAIAVGESTEPEIAEKLVNEKLAGNVV